MPKYTKPLTLDEYDQLTQEEKVAYVSEMVDLPKPPRELSALARRSPPDEKPKARKRSTRKHS